MKIKEISMKFEKSPLEKDTKKYNCEFCSYSCSKKNEWERHILRPKHIERTNSKNIQDYCSLFTCENCNSVYKSTSGLWYHKKKCIKKIEQPETKNDKVVYDTDFDFKSMFIDLMKQNEEFKKIMVEQNTKMMELASSVNTNITSITNNNNGTINNTMNKFNLNFFLNETCKDAMNIQEFIDYVKVQHSDFENFGKYGYVESMTRIIMRNLMELEVHRRPIHCTDAKREVLYVKDNNVWVNDFSREKLIRAIKYIAAKNVKQIPGWMDHNPDSKNTQTKLHDKYMRMVCHSMGGRDEAEDQEYYKKIIHNLAKEVVIDKMR